MTWFLTLYFLGFTGWIFNGHHLHFNIHIAQTRKGVEVFSSVINIQGLGGPVKVAHDNYFAYFDVTHSD